MGSNAVVSVHAAERYLERVLSEDGEHTPDQLHMATAIIKNNLARAKRNVALSKSRNCMVYDLAGGCSALVKDGVVLTIIMGDAKAEKRRRKQASRVKSSTRYRNKNSDVLFGLRSESA